MATKKDFTLKPTTAKQLIRYAAGEPEPERQTEPQPAAAASDPEPAQPIRRTSTAGKPHRITMEFSPAVHEYIRTMARMRGQSVKQFTEDVFIKSMEENAEAYALAQKLKGNI